MTQVDEAEAGERSEARQPLLDRTQKAVYTIVNTTSRWFDGFFGSSEFAEGANVSRGLLAVGTKWDERDDFKNRLRLKARVPLPALEKRLSLLFGRGTADDFVDGSSTENISALPASFNDFDDEDWLLGLGYSRDRTLQEGFDFSVGMSLSSSPDPFVRLTYRWNKVFGDDWLWRLRPRVFWQEERGEGASLTSTLDYAVNPSWLLRSWIILVSDKKNEGLGWTANFIAYHSLSRKNAFSYSLFVDGETENEVELQDYGFEIRYRRRIAREWFFIQLSTGVSWPREFLFEERDSNLSAGIEFEMQFGEWPGRRQAL